MVLELEMFNDYDDKEKKSLWRNIPLALGPLD